MYRDMTSNSIDVKYFDIEGEHYNQLRLHLGGRASWKSQIVNLQKMAVFLLYKLYKDVSYERKFSMDSLFIGIRTEIAPPTFSVQIQLKNFYEVK